MHNRASVLQRFYRRSKLVVVVGSVEGVDKCATLLRTPVSSEWACGLVSGKLGSRRAEVRKKLPQRGGNVEGCGLYVRFSLSFPALPTLLEGGSRAL